MILDERNEFADATALNTGGAGTYLVGDVIDLGLLYGGTVGDNVNLVEDLYLVVQVDTTATSGGSATGQFHLVSDAQAAIATDGSATYHFSTGAIPVATLVAGYEIAMVRLPKGTYERYLGILQTTGTAAFTAGKINAFLTMSPKAHRNFPDAI